MKKIISFILALCLMVGSLVCTVIAEQNEEEASLSFEENFDGYEENTAGKSTSLNDYFVCDANSIGGGYIKVQKNESGNLYLHSHVFTQVYTKTPIEGAYEFSMDVLEAKGTVSAAVLIRAAKLPIPYYEQDGRPENSVCQSGLLLYPHANSLGINIKTYNPDQPGKIDNNTVVLPFAEGISYGFDNPMPLRVTDDGETIRIYVNDELFFYVIVSEPGQYFELHRTDDACYGKAVMYNADGTEIATYTNPVMGSDYAYIGWVTRASDMSVDNICVKSFADE